MAFDQAADGVGRLELRAFGMDLIVRLLLRFRPSGVAHGTKLATSVQQFPTGWGKTL